MFEANGIFDLWSITHIFLGIIVGAIIQKINQNKIQTFAENLFEKIIINIQTKAPESIKILKKIKKDTFFQIFHFDITGVLLIAYIWEAIEHYMELGAFSLELAQYLNGTESWANRLITDPLMLVVGYAIAYKYPKMYYPALIIIIIWYTVHFFFFPDLMYLHRFL